MTTLSQHQPQPKLDWPRLRFRILFASLITVLVLSWVAIEGFLRWLPFHPSNQTIAPWLILIGPLGYLLLRLSIRLRARDSELAQFAETILAICDQTKLFVLRFSRHGMRLLAVLTIGLCVIWIPEYLVQPLWTDHEHVLIMARFWDKGLFPWTAMMTYQFPGEMEFAWLSARLFGWGNPVGFFLLDMLLKVLLAVILLKWSIRQLGSWHYALLGIIGQLAIELSLPFTNVAQRDTHTVMLAILAITFPGALASQRFATFLSAMAFGFGMAIRPHMIFFLPAVLCGQVWATVTTQGMSQFHRQQWSAVFRSVGLWLGFAALAVPFFLWPILGLKQTPAFLEALRFPFLQDSPYASPPFEDIAYVFRDAYRIPRNFWFFTLSLLMISFPGTARWRYRGMMLVTLGLSGLLYRAIHPVDHGYLRIPMQYLECLGLVIIPAWLVDRSEAIPGLIWLSLAGLTGYIVTVNPVFYVEAGYWPKAVRYLVSGKDPGYSPPGARSAYPVTDWTYHYDWVDWVAASDWLRLETSPETRILNLTSYQPFPPLCGTVDRLPLGRLESIVLMNWFRKYDFEPEMMEQLKNAPAGSLVVWDEYRMNPDNIFRLRNVISTIEKYYQPRVRFGEIEFWEKLPE